MLLFDISIIGIVVVIVIWIRNRYIRIEQWLRQFIINLIVEITHIVIWFESSFSLLISIVILSLLILTIIIQITYFWICSFRAFHVPNTKAWKGREKGVKRQETWKNSWKKLGKLEKLEKGLKMKDKLDNRVSSQRE